MSGSGPDDRQRSVLENERIEMTRFAIRTSIPVTLPRTAADSNPDPVAAIIIITATIMDAVLTIIQGTLRPFFPSNLLVTDDEDIIRQHVVEHTDAGTAESG